MSVKVHYIADRLKYFPDIGGPYCIPTKYGDTYEEDEIEIHWDGNVPFWFLIEYIDVIKKIDYFNVYWENLKRRFHEPTTEEIEEFLRKKEYDNPLNQFYEKYKVTYQTPESSYLDQLGRAYSEAEIKQALQNIREYYWTSLDYDAFDNSYINKQPWILDPLMGPQSDFTEELKEHAEICKNPVSAKNMFEILDFYATRLPYFKGINDEEFIERLKKAYKVIKEIHTVAKVKVKRRIAVMEDAARDYKQFIVPKGVTGEDQLYILGNRDKSANFNKFESDVMRCDTRIFESEMNYYKEQLDYYKNKGLDSWTAYKYYGLGHVSGIHLFSNVETDETKVIGCFDPKVMALVKGAIEAYIAFSEFMLEVLWKDENVEVDRRLIAKMPLDKFLVRCCGLSLVEGKTIKTSIINYEEAFKEYIENGWKIEFISPIVVQDGHLQVIDKNGEFHEFRRRKKPKKIDLVRKNLKQ